MSTTHTQRQPLARKSDRKIATKSDDIPMSDVVNSGYVRWPDIACGAVAAIGVAWAAAYVTLKGGDRDVGIAAWVCAAITGTSATISAASGPRSPRIATELKKLAQQGEQSARTE